MACLSVKGAHNQILGVGGPEILHREDIPRVFGRILNQEPIIINPSLFLFDGVRSAVGLLNSQAQKALGTLRVLLANEFFCTRDEVLNLESIFNLKLETLETFLRRYLGV